MKSMPGTKGYIGQKLLLRLLANRIQFITVHTVFARQKHLFYAGLHYLLCYDCDRDLNPCGHDNLRSNIHEECHGFHPDEES